MAKPPKHLIGLDIDPSGIAAAQVRVNGRITVDRAAVGSLEPGILRDGEVVGTEGLSEALRALWRDNKGLGKRVRVGVANQKIVVRVLHVPPTENAAELDAAVRFQAPDQLPMPLDKAVLDYVPLEPEAGDEGARRDPPRAATPPRRVAPRWGGARRERGPPSRPKADGHRPLRLRDG